MLETQELSPNFLSEDSVLSALIADFRQAAFGLRYVDLLEFDLAVADLCEASREILLSLGPPELSDQRMLADLSDLFRSCATSIEEMASPNSESILFARYIRERADDIGI